MTLKGLLSCQIYASLTLSLVIETTFKSWLPPIRPGSAHGTKDERDPCTKPSRGNNDSTYFRGLLCDP